MIFALIALLCLGPGQKSSLAAGINGEDTDTAAHPHQVSLQYKNSHSCGGSIIGEFWVLTAAQCVQGDNITDYTIEINDGRRGSNSRKLQVDTITEHPQYKKGPGAYTNDVAVLRVAESLTSQAEPVRGKAIKMAALGTFAGQRCVITGWGRDENGTIPWQLQETDGDVMTDNQCGSWWGSNYVGPVHICIANPQTGACNGDSGGPMVCGGLLAGVMSWGVSGCATNYPSVNARVSEFNSWINSAMV